MASSKTVCRIFDSDLLLEEFILDPADRRCARIEIPELGEYQVVEFDREFEQFIKSGRPHMRFNVSVYRTIEKFGKALQFRRDILLELSVLKEPGAGAVRSWLMLLLLASLMFLSFCVRATPPDPEAVAGSVIRDCADCPLMVPIPGRPYALGKHEVTQAQWRAIMGSNPSHFSACGNDCPVEQVSWDDAHAFIAALNSRTKGGYRLPTSEEWGHACTAGRKGDPCRFDYRDESGWYWYNGGGRTRPVGQKAPNPWGLHDMTGNVDEWVEDCHEGDCGDHVLRGGSWFCSVLSARLECPRWGSPTTRADFIGFRVLRAVTGDRD